ncbi:MAG: phenylacetate--CoA ligase family protein [Haloferacaceae archaeon]
MTTEIDAVERLSLPAYQREAMDDLRAQLRTVAETPFYRRKFEEAGVDPADVESPRDLRALPFTRKDELRTSQERAPPFGGHRACDPADIARVYSTSGTSGRPTFVGLTDSDLDVWTRASARAARAAGLGRGDVVVGVLAGGPFAGAVTYDGHRATGATIAPVGPGNTGRVLTLFENGCGTALLATPSYAEYLLEAVRERDVDPASLGIERMLVGGEPGAVDVRERVEPAFDCVLTESMGNSDVSISLWGECRHRTGMHFTGQGAAYPELLDPETGEPLPWTVGTRGELVYTSLNRECVPLVRFRSGDRVEVVAEECPCGRETACIRVLGRTDEMFIVRGVNVFPSAVKSVVADLPGTTAHLRIHLPEGQTHVDAPVPITVERTTDADVDAEALAERVQTALRERLVFRADVDVVPAGTLDRPQYKARLIERV